MFCGPIEFFGSKGPRRLASLFLLASLLVLPVAAAGVSSAEKAIEVVSGPFLTTAPRAPLTGVLELATNQATRVQVTATDGVETWERQFYAFQKEHDLTVAGFKAGRTYQVELTLFDLAGDSVTLSERIELHVDPLPADFPPIQTLVSDPSRMEPGYTLFGPDNRNPDTRDFTLILDSAGEVVWYIEMEGGDWRQLPNGHFLHILGLGGPISEVNLRGEVVRSWYPARSSEPSENGIAVDDAFFHHEAFPTPFGTLLTLLHEPRTVSSYPSSLEDPFAPRQTVEVNDNPVLEFSMETGEIVNRWSLHDILDPTRIGMRSLQVRTDGSFNWGHGNAIIHDPRDDTVIVSLRHQNAVVKLSRTTGELKWILGPHHNWGPEFERYLFQPTGLPFEWQWAQHAPTITPHGTLLLFDNGNERASPFHGIPVANEDNYSRAVEYRINEQTMEITQVWEYGRYAEERLYTSFLCDADWMNATGNVLITFGGTSLINGGATMGNVVRLVEVTHETPAEKVFEIDISDDTPGTRGWILYRAERIADLYPARLAASLDADKPQRLHLLKAGTVTMTAEGSGGSGRYEYFFRVRDPSGVWNLGQEYGASSTFSWSPDAVGDWTVEVQVRNQGSSAVFETLQHMNFRVVNALINP